MRSGFVEAGCWSSMGLGPHVPWDAFRGVAGWQPAEALFGVQKSDPTKRSSLQACPKTEAC